MASANYYAYLAYRLVEGDDVLADLFMHLERDGFVNEEGEWNYGEEDQGSHYGSKPPGPSDPPEPVPLRVG